jgi:putative membrane protein
MTMKHSTALLATVCALLAAPAFAQSGSMPNNSMQNKASPSSGATTSETQGAAPSGQAAMSTQDFVNKAAISDMFEIQSSQLAQQKDKQKLDKKFAKHMIKDHTKTTKQLKTMVESGKVKAELPTALDSEHQQKLDKLKGLSGKEFDQAYDQAQKEGHAQAVAVFQDYARSGDNPQLKQWAKKTLPTLKEHLSMAKKLM